MNIMKLTIKRSEWARGKSSVEGNSLFKGYRVLHDTGCSRIEGPQRCCLGFLGNAVGYSDQELDGEGLPHEHANDRTQRDGDRFQLLWPSWLVRQHDDPDVIGRLFIASSLETDLVNVNDNEDIDDEQRERDIMGLFDAVGVAVEFIP